MANKKYKDPKKVITGPQTRWSFVHVWEPVKVGDDDNAKLKYSISLIIPKASGWTNTVRITDSY